jgi:hypothetical protein
MRITRFKFAPTVITALLFTVVAAASAQRSLAQEWRRYAAPARESRRADIKLAEMPAAFEGLKRLVRRPEQIDGATKRLRIEPALINFNLATPVDLSDIGLGKAVYLPIQVSDREGGRTSLFFLSPGEKVLAGIFVSDDGVALRYVTRLDGRSNPARTGDLYETTVTNMQGEAIHQEQGRLRVIDPEHGIAEFIPLGGGRSAGARTRGSVWMLWSSLYLQRNRGGYY